jgi:predicted 3-demethylubiquinone-9 3-methyltransferase (glyoxalase superfamily)
MRKTSKTAGHPRRVGVEGITPFLWFDDQAEAAARLYVSLFERSRILEVNRADGSGEDGEGPVQSVSFELGGREFIAFNGGPIFGLTPAFSMFVRCRTQRQVDALWERLTEGGEESRCGWLVDPFGLSWHIIPDRLVELLRDPDPRRAGRALAAMMKMRKIDIRALELAVRGRGATRAPAAGDPRPPAFRVGSRPRHRRR